MDVGAIVRRSSGKAGFFFLFFLFPGLLIRVFCGREHGTKVQEMSRVCLRVLFSPSCVLDCFSGY